MRPPAHPAAPPQAGQIPVALRLPAIDRSRIPFVRVVENAVSLSVAALILLTVAAGVVAAVTSIDITVEGAGVLEPRHVSVLRALEPGIVARVNVSTGQAVREGQSVVALDSFGLVNQLRQLEARRVALDAEMTDATVASPADQMRVAGMVRDADALATHSGAVLIDRLRECGMLGDSDFPPPMVVSRVRCAVDDLLEDYQNAMATQVRAHADSLRTGLDALEVRQALIAARRVKASIRLVHAQLRQLPLTAFEAGIVLTPNPGRLVGAYVHAGDAILEIADQREWQASVLLDERRARDVRPGDPVRVMIDDPHQLGLGLRVGHVVSILADVSTDSVAETRLPPKPVDPMLRGPALAKEPRDAVKYRVIVALDAQTGSDDIHRRYHVTTSILTRHDHIASLIHDYLRTREWGARYIPRRPDT